MPQSQPTKLIILDRDGVINHDSPDFIKSPDEWIPIPGSLEAIARLNQAGYRVVIASNQSGIARQYFDINTLNAIHQKLHRGEKTYIFGEYLGEHVDTSCFISGDHQFSTGVAIQFVDGVLGAAAEIEHLLGVFAEDLARSCE